MIGHSHASNPLISLAYHCSCQLSVCLSALHPFPFFLLVLTSDTQWEEVWLWEPNFTLLVELVSIWLVCVCMYVRTYVRNPNLLPAKSCTTT